MLTPLPIDPLLPDVVAALRAANALVLEAEPGAGKTTRVPWALMEAGLAGNGEVLVLQPRRLAARLAARRIAEERGEKLGERVGYQVRFEEVSSARTRLRLITEGVLTRRLLADPTLRGVGAVVLDEIHERHLPGDLGLALLRQLQDRRPDLKLVVMSATLDAAPIARFLGGCPSLRASGRRFEVKTDHLEAPDARPLEAQVASAVRQLLREGLDGDVLVFLPGAAEIRRAREACEAAAQSADLLVLPLHGDLPPAEQDRAVRPAERRKIVLSTNVAESSVTIDGVAAVVDSGLARSAGHSPWSGMPTLKVARVSKASAIQRAGRAGRTRPGRCLRLYTRHDFETRPNHEVPEIARLDLAETALALHGMGVRDLAAFPWFEPPPSAALAAAEELLARLGAVDAPGGLTELGRSMLAYPLHPRQARVLLEARARGEGDDGCVLAALLGEGEIRQGARGGLFEGGGPRRAKVSGPSDLLESLEAFREAQRAGLEPHRLKGLGLDVGATLAVDRVRKQLARAGGPKPSHPRDGDPDRALLLAILAGYPDRVARRRQKDQPGGGPSNELLLSGGGTATLAEASTVRDAAFLVAVEAEERAARGPGEPRGGVMVRTASAIEPDWLLELHPDRVTATTEARWNAQAQRVEATSRLTYDGLVLEESRESKVDPKRAAELLEAAAREAGPTAFAPPGELESFVGRTRFAAGAAPDAQIAPLSDADVDQALAALCEGRSSFAELRECSLLDALRARAGAKLGLLDEIAPASIRLPGGRQVRVHYEPGKPPWIESFLQDFFGLAEGPRVARGRVPLVLHLLAPNRRAVQVTTDLKGFWERHYPSLRKELGRRYPRHSWPDDPRGASPPPPRGARR